MCSSSFSCTSYLHFPHGLHMDAAALATLLESRVKGIHQDDSSQARSLLPLHVLQKHLSLLHFVADDRGDVSCKETKRVNTSSVREIKKDPDEGLIWYAVNASLRFSKFSPLLLTLIRSVQSIVPRISDSAALICTKSPQIIVVSVASGHFKSWAIWQEECVKLNKALSYPPGGELRPHCYCVSCCFKTRTHTVYVERLRPTTSWFHPILFSKNLYLCLKK